MNQWTKQIAVWDRTTPQTWDRFWATELKGKKKTQMGEMSRDILEPGEGNGKKQDVN